MLDRLNSKQNLIRTQRASNGQIITNFKNTFTSSNMESQK